MKPNVNKQQKSKFGVLKLNQLVVELLYKSNMGWVSLPTPLPLLSYGLNNKPTCANTNEMNCLPSIGANAYTSKA